MVLNDIEATPEAVLSYRQNQQNRI